MGNVHLQNKNQTWVRLGTSHLLSHDSGMSSRADSEITDSRLFTTITALPACYKQHENREIKKLSWARHVLASAARTLKLGLYIEAPKVLSASMKLSLPGTVAHRKLSFRRLKNQLNKNFEDGCLRPARPTWEISVFRTEKNLG